jgi:large subunit ribosomal protein L23
MSQAAHQERLMTVIRGPHFSEKAHFAAENDQVVLKVRTDATKKEVAQAVKLLFNKVEEVKAVQVVNVKGKAKRFQQTKGRRPNWKKAYVKVKLADGTSIEELFGTE